MSRSRPRRALALAVPDPDPAARRIEKIKPVWSVETHPEPVKAYPELAAPEHGRGLDSGLGHSHGPIVHRPTTIEDIDRLWDWIRADADVGETPFLGTRPGTSLALHQYMAAITTEEEAGRALLASLMQDEAHVGFVLLRPIDLEAKVAVVHLYIAPAHRGMLRSVVSSLLAVFDTRFPGFRLLAFTARRGFATVLRDDGFEQTYLLVRPERS